jgi:glycosyltransferase involved in cell wall biosynthesis
VIHAYGGDLLSEQYAGRPALERAFTSWSCRSADRVVVTGQHMIDAAAGLGVPRERLMLLPRGVDLDRYRPGLDTSELRRRLAIADTDPVVLSPRYQVDETLYNLDVVVDAFAAVRRIHSRAVCVQLYEPSRERGRARLELLAAERGVADAFRLVPAVDNASMPLYYNLADVVVSVPSSDGFPVTVLEASACAAPLVVSDLPYTGEWFHRDGNGTVVPVRDAKRLADAVIALLADAPRRQEMGAAGRQLVSARADYRRCMDELESVYEHLLTPRAGARKDV